jgi:glycosyltransferase involved in cell wall biosynthesis
LKRIAFLGRGGHTLPTYRAVLNGLAEQHTLVVLSETPIDPEWMQLEHRYEFRSLSSRKLPRRLREFFFILNLIREQWRNPFDVIHAHSTYPTGFAAVVVQKLFGIPAVVSLDGGEGASFPDLKFGDRHNYRRTLINRWVIKHAAEVTTLTDFHRDQLVKHLGIQRKILVIPRGVDLKKFVFKENQTQEPIVFLSVGYLSPIKDPNTLLKTFFIIQQQMESQLIIVGKDFMHGSVQQTAEALGISDKIEFRTYADHDTMPEVYREADVLLHTAVYESQGMVAVEAMASGAVVCGTRVGILSDLSGDCCLTVELRDAEGLAHVVLELVRSNEKFYAQRLRARQWTEKNDLRHTIGKYLDIYNKLIQ